MYAENEARNIMAFTLVATGIGFLALYLKKRNSNKTNNTSMEKKLPRGYRNNNPLNIRINPGNNWDGKVANNTDGVFEQFVAMEYGYRAAMKLIRNYITKYDLNTVGQIISKWAPDSENDTAGYISRVSSTTGWLPTKEIDPYNMQEICDLVYAMAIVENGYTPLPDYTEIYKGWEML